jgi:putative ABC transport system ATP-binding protein
MNPARVEARSTSPDAGPTGVVARCEAVSRTYRTGDALLHAVRGVDCVVRATARVAVSGPSGSGKSTLLHLLAGLDRPTAGAVDWPDLGRAADGRPARVSVVFQGPSLVPTLDVAENVALPLVLSGVPAAQAQPCAAAALERLELDGLAALLPEELSGGQAQRVAVARALAHRPRLLLADEPTGQLDRDTGARLLAVLLSAVDELGAALVVATHDPAVAELLREQWLMDHGSLVSAASAP